MINVKRKLLMRAITSVIAFAVVLGGFTLLANRGLEGASAAPITVTGNTLAISTYDVTFDEDNINVSLSYSYNAIGSATQISTQNIVIACYEGNYNSFNDLPSASSALYRYNTQKLSNSLNISIPLETFGLNFDGNHTYTFAVYTNSWTFMSKTYYGRINDVFKVTPIKTVPLPPDPTKDGHTFIGWFYDAECTIPYMGEPITEHTTLYAGWQIHTFTVTYDDGTTTTTQTVDWNTTANEFTPIREGYIFRGWFTNSSLTTAYNFDTAVKSDITLYAKWERITYTITFVLNNGQDNITIEVPHGTRLEDSPEVKSLLKHSFGAFTDEQLLTAFDTTQIVTSDLTVHTQLTSQFSNYLVFAEMVYTYWYLAIIAVALVLVLLCYVTYKIAS